MKTILVTGGTGFIGHHSIPLLLAEGYDVHTTIRDKTKINKFNPDIQYHDCDLFDHYQQEQLLNSLKPSHLLHFAWDAIPGKFWSSPDNLQWVEASLILLRNFVRFGGQRVVFAGTCAEYDWSYGYCTENVTPTNPQTLYGVCKNSLRQIFEQYCQQSGVSYAWGRIFWLYGINEYPERLVPSIIHNLVNNQPAKCTDGQQIRDFMYVEDVSHAFVSLLNSNVKGVVNIGSGQPITIKEIVIEISNKLNAHDLLRFGEIQTPLNDPPLVVANSMRLRKEINFEPQYNLRQGLQKTIDYLLANKYNMTL
jgi:nucleoside-diphosphate-sugar epimerase